MLGQRVACDAAAQVDQLLLRDADLEGPDGGVLRPAAASLGGAWAGQSCSA